MVNINLSSGNKLYFHTKSLSFTTAYKIKYTQPKYAYTHIDRKQTNRQTDKYTHKQTETDMHTDTHTDTQTHTHA